MISIINSITEVYHGTISIYKRSLLKKIDLNRGNDYVDFGKGFYTTTNLKQAKSFAIITAKRNNLYQKKKMKIHDEWEPRFANPMIMVYNLNTKRILKDYNGITFSNPNSKWKEFVFNNRLGKNYFVSDCHNLDKKFDYVYGCMADSKIAPLIERYKQDKISFKDFCDAIEPYDSHNQDQLSFHTRGTLKCISLKKCEII